VNVSFRVSLIFSVYLENTRNVSKRLRIRKETLGVLREYAKRHKSVYVSVNNNTNLDFLNILFIFTIWNGLGQKQTHAAVTLKRIVRREA
jgi:hypothetical protein